MHKHRAMRLVHWTHWVLVALLFLLLATSLWTAIIENVDSDGGDQGAFLSLGMDIRAREALTDGNRHPLFSAIISPFAGRDWSYFTTGKLFSGAFTLLSLVALVALGRSLLGWEAAALAGIAWALNSELIHQGSQVLSESLLAGLSFIAWFSAIRAIERADSLGRGLLAGAMLGLVYLTKSVGTMLLAAQLAAFVAVSGIRGLRHKGFWTFIAGALLVVSPLLVYSSRTYGNALYDFNSTHAMWFESWDDRYLPAETWPTLASYLQQHTLGQMASRLGQGLVSILPVMAETLRIGGWAWTGWLLLMGQVAIALAGIWLVIRRQVEGTWQIAVVLSAARWWLLYVMHAWFAQVTDAPRFFLPLTPETLLLIGAAVVWATRRWTPANWKQPGKWLWPLATIAVLMLLLIRLPEADWVDPYASDRAANKGSGDVIGWLNARGETEPVCARVRTKVLFGPSHSLPRWMLNDWVTLDPIPDDVESWEALQAYVIESGAQFIILDKKMYTRRDEALEPRFDKDGSTVLFRWAPDDWQYLRAWSGTEYNWYLLEARSPALRAQLAANDGSGQPIARFGQSIRLVDIGVERKATIYGTEIAISPVWATDTVLDDNLTLYCHLLDSTGNRIAQWDSQPLGGMYPTYLWKEGETILDHIVVDAVGEPVEPLVARIGFYDWQTKDRLPVIVEEASLAAEDGKAIVLPMPEFVGVGAVPGACPVGVVETEE